MTTEIEGLLNYVDYLFKMQADEISEEQNPAIRLREVLARERDAPRAEIAENEGVIAVWRRRAETAEAALATARAAAIEEAAAVCEQQRDDFLSPEYATSQPLSTISKRFACACCAAAIRALGKEGRTPPAADEGKHP